MQPPIGAPGAMPQNRPLTARGDTSNYRVLFFFHPKNDGANPFGSPVKVRGKLYGTTSSGSAGRAGTVFSITTSGKEHTLYSFRKGTSDGSTPEAGLIHLKGTLYGTTEFGGTGAHGTIFSITTAGVENVLYRFPGNRFHGGPRRGARPVASLIDVGGTLYGTAEDGGADDHGTVFGITTSGAENELYSFAGPLDGAHPVASLINVGGTLYGTTENGGEYNGGTVFSITTSGTENVLYSFGSGEDGSYPEARLIDVGGTLYGTTFYGGANGDGAVFSITTGGTEKVLYSFRDGPDGKNPEAGLIDVNGKLYGTTKYGGDSGCSGYGGCGTIFSVTTSGAEKVLHSFGGAGSDGENPEGLFDLAGVLYGVTTYGGPTHCFNGCGTVFALNPNR
jgi:uncharacterized repeat protein (TIGR03803 family)